MALPMNSAVYVNASVPFSDTILNTMLSRNSMCRIDYTVHTDTPVHADSTVHTNAMLYAQDNASAGFSAECCVWCGQPCQEGLKVHLRVMKDCRRKMLKARQWMKLTPECMACGERLCGVQSHYLHYAMYIRCRKHCLHLMYDITWEEQCEQCRQNEKAGRMAEQEVNFSEACEIASGVGTSTDSNMPIISGASVTSDMTSDHDASTTATSDSFDVTETTSVPTTYSTVPTFICTASTVGSTGSSTTSAMGRSLFTAHAVTKDLAAIAARTTVASDDADAAAHAIVVSETYSSLDLDYRILPYNLWHCFLCHNEFYDARALLQHMMVYVPCRLVFLSKKRNNFGCFCCMESFPALYLHQKHLMSEPLHRAVHQTVFEARVQKAQQLGQRIENCGRCFGTFLIPGSYHCLFCYSVFHTAQSLQEHWNINMVCHRSLVELLSDLRHVDLKGFIQEQMTAYHNVKSLLLNPKVLQQTEEELKQNAEQLMKNVGTSSHHRVESCSKTELPGKST